MIVISMISINNLQLAVVDNVTRGVEETGSINIITAYYLSYRLFDTLFEIFVFTIGVQGVVFFLSHIPSLEKHTPMREKALIIYTDLLFGASLITGMYIAIAGHISPGGGFVGGIVGATGAVLVFLTMPIEEIEKDFPHKHIAFWEMIILLFILVIVIIPVMLSLPPMRNFLPLGTPGEIFSAGTIPIIDTLIGIKVLIGAITIAQAFIKHRGVF